MADYVTVAEARKMHGMRIVCANVVPGPWAESIRNMLDLKKIPYTRALFELGGDHGDLVAWSAQDSVPVIAWNDEHPKSNWAEQLYLVERIEPRPALVPADLALRTTMFGLANEICGMHGFGWNRRMINVHMMLSNPDLPAEARGMFEAFGAKYGYSPEAAAAATPRTLEILGALTAQLERQRSAGSRYLIGDELSALDVYWASFSHLIDPLPPEQNPMVDDFRPAYKNFDPAVDAAAELLMEHRDFIYQEHLVLPIDL